MQHIVNTDVIAISFDENKCRLYPSIKGFWPRDTEKRKFEMQIAQIILEQLPEQMTMLLDMSGLKIMQPKLAEEVIQGFKFLLAIKHIQAVAVVEDPENTLDGSRFHRTAGILEQNSKSPIGVFINKNDAEAWLDQVV